MTVLGMMPSEWFQDALLKARRLGARQDRETVAMLVVEGDGDARILEPHCEFGSQQVMPVEGRDNVEGVIREFRRQAPDGLELVGLTDCDGLGKTADLSADLALIVTQGCDAEADLFLLGAVDRALESFGVQNAGELSSRAMDMAVPMSALRRGAHASKVSMKLPMPGRHPRRLPFSQLGDAVMATCAESSFEEALDVVGSACADALGWEDEVLQLVLAESPRRDAAAFAAVGSGKDAFAALGWLTHDIGALKDIQADKFVEHCERQVNALDFPEWHVGRRLLSWQATTGVELLKAA